MKADGRSSLLVVREGDRIWRLRWNESIRPGYGANTDSPDSYVDLVQCRFAAKVLLASGITHAGERVPARWNADASGSIWGYELDEPWRTSWL